MAYRIHSAQADYRGDGEQRECARGERCAAATVVRQDDGTYLRQAALGYRTMCEIDRSFVLRSVEQMPGYHRDLLDQLGEKTGASGPKVSGSRSAPAPLNLTFEALATDIVDVVASWAGRVAYVAGLLGSDTDRRIRAYADEPLTRMCTMLALRLDGMLSLGSEPMARFLSLADAAKLPPGTPGRVHPNAGYAEALLDLDGADAGLEFLRLNARCRWMLGLIGADEEVPVPCWNPDCGLRGTVFRPDGAAGLADYAQCRACGETYYADRYMRLMAEVRQREVARQQEKKAS